jgi:hypothetical protein
LLAVAVYFLIKSKPNLFLFELIQEAFGETKESPADPANISTDLQTRRQDPAENK